MKNGIKIALAVALIGGVSATALTIDSAMARGWGDGWGPSQMMGKMMGKGGFGGRGNGPAAMFTQFDADKDGALTKAEITAGLEKKITDNDKDGDKAVSLEEFKAEWAKMTQDRMVRAYQRMDRDGNGKVTAEELKGQATFMFDRMDRNSDGKIDKTDRPNRDRFDRRGGRDGKFDGRWGRQGNGPQGNWGNGQGPWGQQTPWGQPAPQQAPKS